MALRVRPQSALAAVGAVTFAVGIAAAPTPAPAQSNEPIKIGFSLALTGPLAPNGKQALLGAKIWQEEINAKDGLLGRKVAFVNYDDQSNPTNIPGIYTKLLDVDKVDLVNGPYGTNLVAPAIPIVMQKQKVLIGLFGLDANKEFHYSRYFSMIPAGPNQASRSRKDTFRLPLSRRRSRRPSRSRARTPSSAATPAEVRAKTRRPMVSTSSTTRRSRRARPTSRRSFARYRPPKRILSYCVPIR